MCNRCIVAFIVNPGIIEMPSHRPVTALLTVLALAGLLALAPAAADARSSAVMQLAQSDSRPESRPRISAGQAASIVQRRYGGQVVDVDMRQSGGRVIYRVRILQDDGRIRTVRVNGETGEIMGR